jgi:3-mercaptopyruvate sulfurtransferase SseA
MERLITFLTVGVLLVCATSSSAQSQRRYPVDPQTRWAVGARATPADELKKQLDNGSVMIIDVRPPASFERETIPGAINVPLDELERHLKKMSKDIYIVFT